MLSSLFYVHFATITTVFTFLLVLLGVFIQQRQSANSSTKHGCRLNQTCCNILLVIAHPDDEAMFFVPAIVSLIARGYKFGILCLSSGDYDGLGKIRRKELLQSCKVLGIATKSVLVSDLPDGPQNKWDTSVVCQEITEAVQRLESQVILTFDESGVSKHANHTAVYHGVKSYLKNRGATKTIRSAWQLQTTSLLRKYLGIWDLLPSLWRIKRSALQYDGDLIDLKTLEHPSAITIAFVLCKPWTNWASMKSHASQFVWYRRLFIVFSRYTYINTLTLMK